MKRWTLSVNFREQGEACYFLPWMLVPMSRSSVKRKTWSTVKSSVNVIAWLCQKQRIWVKMIAVKTCGKPLLGWWICYFRARQLALIKAIPIYMKADSFSDSYRVSTRLRLISQWLDAKSWTHSLIQETIALWRLPCCSRSGLLRPFPWNSGKMEREGKKFGLGLWLKWRTKQTDSLCLVVTVDG